MNHRHPGASALISLLYVAGFVIVLALAVMSR